MMDCTDMDSYIYEVHRKKGEVEKRRNLYFFLILSGIRIHSTYVCKGVSSMYGWYKREMLDTLLVLMEAREGQ